MPEFSYKAKNRRGKIISGKINSKSKNSAKNDLFNRGLVPIKLNRRASIDESAQATGIQRFIYKDANGAIQIRVGSELPTTKELALFAKQFSLMIENGIAMPKALGLLEKNQKKLQFANIIRSISSDVERGSSLHEALEPYPKVFDELFVARIKAGEASGQLDIILKQLVIYIEKAAKIKSQLKSAMAYPTIIVVVAVAVITLLLAFVVPSFAKQFQESGQELPAMTQVVIDMSNLLADNWIYIIGGAMGGGFLVKYWLSTDNGRAVFDQFILKAPIIGDVMTKIAVSRFCSTMSTMLSSGVNILESLKICASASGNKTVETFVFGVKEEIQRGGNFYSPLEASSLFPPLVTSMVRVGEETGKLDETLKKITEIYEDEVDTAIATMTSMIEPLMIVIIGSIVGFIVLAMYLPIFDMANTAVG